MMYFSLYPIRNSYQTKATNDNIASELYCLNIPINLIFYHNVIIFFVRQQGRSDSMYCIIYNITDQ